MSDQGDPAGPSGPAGGDERDGRDGGGLGRGGAGRGGADRGAADHGGAGHGGADRDGAGRDSADRGGQPASGTPFSTPVRIGVGIGGPVLLTTAYFTLPFDPIGPEHRALAWVILVGLLVLLALGMVVTTNRALTDTSGRFHSPGLGILLLSWASILVFAAAYWSMATHHGQFVGLQTRLDSLYFTGVTIATVGYGDIHPSGQLARAVVLVQLVYTFAFLVSGVTAVRTRNQARRTRRMSGGA